MSMADRIVIMKDGEVIQIGTPDDVYHRSANIFVADFIGTPPTNFINVSIAAEGGTTYLQNAHLKYALSEEQAAILKGYDKTELILGVRPENILLTSESDAVFSAPCLLSEPQGSHQIVAIQLDEEIIKVLAPSEPKINSGEIVHMRFKQDTLRMFDPETTLAIGN
jgi:multiple sugar transport system ATP-binding protein